MIYKTEKETTCKWRRQNVVKVGKHRTANLHVVLKNTRPAECPITHRALVRLDSGVDAPVDLKVAGRCEPLPTNITLERFASTV